MSDWVSVVARFRLPDGREFDVHHDCRADRVAGQPWYWLAGTLACDCRRATLLNAEHGVGLDTSCGTSIQLLSLLVDGVPVSGAGVG